MTKIDEILFSKETKLPDNSSNVLFNTNINWDTDCLSIDVSYTSLKLDKKIGDNIIQADEQLIVVGYDEESNMFNVCYKEEKSDIFFWVNSSEINESKIIKEDWTIDEVRQHYKSLNNKWIQIGKNTTSELNKKKSNQEKTEKKE